MIGPTFRRSRRTRIKSSDGCPLSGGPNFGSWSRAVQWCAHPPAAKVWLTQFRDRIYLLRINPILCHFRPRNALRQPLAAQRRPPPPSPALRRLLNPVRRKKGKYPRNHQYGSETSHPRPTRTKPNPPPLGTSRVDVECPLRFLPRQVRHQLFFPSR